MPMRRLAIFLVCCIGALGAYILVRELRVPRYRPVLVVDDGRSGDERWIANVLATCPGIALGEKGNVEGTTHYLLTLSQSDNRWHGILWQNVAAQEYLLWVGVDPEYNKLLADACSRLKDEARYASPEPSAGERADASRYDLHDLRNGNIATSAILDRKTGRVWVWTSVTNSKGEKAKSEFVEEDLVPSPTK